MFVRLPLHTRQAKRLGNNCNLRYENNTFFLYPSFNVPIQIINNNNNNRFASTKCT